jgi:arsenate reductase
MPPPLRVLFICSANSARSVMAESLRAALGGGRFEALSAGSHPSGRVHPLAIETLARAGYPVAGMRSKGWEEFVRKGTPPIDFVITVCDAAAGEVCPIFPGRPVSAHWSIPDPAAAGGDEDAVRRAFSDTLRELRSRVQQFTSLPFDSLDRIALQRPLREIGGS